jgi:hypothetical protein
MLSLSTTARWGIIAGASGIAIPLAIGLWPMYGEYVFWTCLLIVVVLLLSIAWTNSEERRLEFARKPKIDWTNHAGNLVDDDDDWQPLRIDGSRDDVKRRRYSLGATSSYSLNMQVELTDIAPDRGEFAGRLPIPITVDAGGRPYDHPDGYPLYHANCMFLEQIILNNGPPVLRINHPMTGLTRELPSNTQRFRIRAKATRTRPVLGFIPLPTTDTIEESRWIEIGLGRDQFLALKVS